MDGCGESIHSLNQLAAEGSIHQTAPLTAHVVLEIAAPPARIWALLINAPAWPAWGRDIERVNAPGPLANGMNFTWTTGGLTIHSQVQRFQPERSLGWTGHLWTAKAIHQWVLTPERPDRTLVTVEESMDGPWIARLYSSRELTEAAMKRLLALKQAAEQRPPGSAASGYATSAHRH